jgi:CRISPR/Cas system CSM-associated protein Csm3 (group 7 of RAMP superfamily)
MYRKSIPGCLFIITLLLSEAAISQEMVPGSSVQGRSRDVAEYTLREQELMVLIRNINKEDALLAADFEVWSDRVNERQSKAEWMKTAKKIVSVNIHNLSVRLMDDLAVVSFSLETSQGRHKKRSSQFVVDIWRKSTNKLTVRYVSGLY